MKENKFQPNFNKLKCKQWNNFRALNDSKVEQTDVKGVKQMYYEVLIDSRDYPHIVSTMFSCVQCLRYIVHVHAYIFVHIYLSVHICTSRKKPWETTYIYADIVLKCIE